MSQYTIELRHIEEHLAKHGKVDSPELGLLRRLLYVDGKIDRRRANYLVELHRRMRYRTPAWERFFYQALKDHVLADGRVTPGEAAWLRAVLFEGGKVEDEARKFLHQVKGEAQEVSPEFEELLREVTKQPPERHTSG